MSPAARKVVIPVVIIIAGLALTAFILYRQQQRAQIATSPEDDAPAQVDDNDTTGAGTAGSTASEDTGDDGQSDEQPTGGGEVGIVGADEPANGQDASAPVTPGLLQGLRAVAPLGPTDDPAPLGSLDWREASFLIEFSGFGAGIDRITLNDIWNTAEAKRKADRIKRRVERGETPLAEGIASMPDERYVIQSTRDFFINGQDWRFPAFVARQIFINDAAVNLYGTRLGGPTQVESPWSQTPDDPGRFVTEIRNADDEPIARIVRRYRLGEGQYDLIVEQRVENLTDAPLNVRWLQYGQSDLDVDPARYMDFRRFRMGHLGDLARGATPTTVYANTDFLFTRADVVEVGTTNRNLLNTVATPDFVSLWPNEDTGPYDLTWFASQNRYFTVTIHPTIDADTTSSFSLEQVFERIRPFYDGDPKSVPGANNNLAFELWSPPREIAPGGTLTLDFAVYAGPLNEDILDEQQPYSALNMGYLILYQMSACCALCTFQWLAEFLLGFLDFVHAITFDWGIAIILLVVVVRLLLHPITKKSQVSIQRFQKAVQKMAPEIEKLKQKYKDDPKRMQQEQMRLYREYNVSPAQALGCLPMFLQMPIWIALYAMLYFAWDLRHEAAFWGVFQMFGGWQFLGDLSAADHFFWKFANPIEIPLYWAPITGLNLLPILMGVLFYMQQKYMTAQTTANMSKEQQQTQKIMKVMTIVLFPIMLYSAPSGLTLYILTSSTWGILESRYIRNHIDELDLEAEVGKKPSKKKKKKSKDPLAQRYLDAMERAKKKGKPPEKRFKKRK